MACQPTFNYSAWASVSEAAVCLITAMLDKDENSRLSIDQVLADPWLQPELTKRLSFSSRKTLEYDNGSE